MVFVYKKNKFLTKKIKQYRRYDQNKKQNKNALKKIFCINIDEIVVSNIVQVLYCIIFEFCKSFINILIQLEILCKIVYSYWSFDYKRQKINDYKRIDENLKQYIDVYGENRDEYVKNSSRRYI